MFGTVPGKENKWDEKIRPIIENEFVEEYLYKIQKWWNEMEHKHLK